MSKFNLKLRDALGDLIEQIQIEKNGDEAEKSSCCHTERRKTAGDEVVGEQDLVGTSALVRRIFDTSGLPEYILSKHCHIGREANERCRPIRVENAMKHETRNKRKINYNSMKNTSLCTKNQYYRYVKTFACLPNQILLTIWTISSSSST